MGEIVVDAGLVKAAAEAYLYGFPLVFNLDQVERYVTTGWARTRRRRSTRSATRAAGRARRTRS